MSTTIDHLSADHEVTVIQEFTDAGGIHVAAGTVGHIDRIELDWPQYEIQIAWERNGRKETLRFALAATSGPRNGKMREFFQVGRRVPDPSRSTPIAPGPGGSAMTTWPPQPVHEANPSGATDVSEVAVACDCDPALHRAVLFESECSVHGCLRCGTVTCTERIGDDGRFTGNRWQAYRKMALGQSVLDWLARWPRIKVDYGAAPGRWPMAAELVRYPTLFYPARVRCEDVTELRETEARLTREQAAQTVAEKLRAAAGRLPPPPKPLPATFSCFGDVWEALQLDPQSDLETLLHFAQLRHRATALAADLLRRRPDAFEIMVSGLRSGNPVRASAAIAMARDARPVDPRLERVLIDLIRQIPLVPLPEVPGRIAGWRRFEELLVVIADLKLASAEMLSFLSEQQRRLARHDAAIIQAIRVVLLELKRELPQASTF